MKTDVLLIHPPVNLEKEGTPIQASYYVGYGLLHIAACLSERGYRVIVWNLGTPQKPTQESIQSGLKTCDPFIVGVELNWLLFSKGAIQVSRALKNFRPEIPVIVGGTHASIFAKEIVQKYRSIDAVLKGEAEKTFALIAERVEKGQSIDDVSGLATSRDGRLRENPITKSGIYERIDDISHYSSRVIANPDGSPVMSPSPLASINTVRGQCRFHCPYCIGSNSAMISGRKKFTAHSSKWIIEQINILIAEGFKEFAFQDYLFLVGQRRLRELAQALRREKITDRIIGFNMTGIPGELGEETLEELSRAGVYNIDYGVETGLNHILKAMGRPYSKNVILDSMKATASKGIVPFTWWMTGFPDERLEDLDESVRFIWETSGAGSIPRWITPIVVLPSTKLFEKAEEYGLKLRLKTFEDFAVYSDVKEKALAWYPETISHETRYLSQNEILRVTARLKIETFKRREEIVENYLKNYGETFSSYHPHISNETLRHDLREVIGYLPRSFF